MSPNMQTLWKLRSERRQLWRKGEVQREHCRGWILPTWLTRRRQQMRSCA